MSTGTRDLAKVAFIAVFGTTIEYYDFILAGLAAALIWPTVYYPQVPPSLALFFSIVTFALGIAVRPIGAFMFGHFGDRLGRKFVMIWTLIIMGVGTLGIILTPGYTSIGILGGILIAIFRIVQGIGIGGQWGGAAVWVIEHAKNSKKRAFWTNFVNLGVPLGLLLSSGVFLAIISSLTRDDLLNWGWRLAFVIGVLVIIIGIIVRYKFAESPIFKQIIDKGETYKLPAVVALKEQWKRIILLAVVFNYMISLFYIATAFNLGYMIRIGVDIKTAFLSEIIGAIVIIFAQVIGSLIGDSIGRKKVILIGSILSILVAYPYMILINTREATNIILAQSMFLGSEMFGYGVIGAFLPENFPTKYRNSGSSLSYQLAAPLSSIASFLAPYFLVAYGASAWIYISGMIVGICLASLLALLFTKETIKVDISK